MEPDTITSAATLIGAGIPLLALLGAGIWKLIARADRKREYRETALINTLKGQLAAKNKEIVRLHKIIDILRADATAWREQLIRHDIEPEPNSWTEHPPEEES